MRYGCLGTPDQSIGEASTNDPIEVDALGGCPQQGCVHPRLLPASAQDSEPQCGARADTREPARTVCSSFHRAQATDRHPTRLLDPSHRADLDRALRGRMQFDYLRTDAWISSRTLREHLQAEPGESLFRLQLPVALQGLWTAPCDVAAHRVRRTRQGPDRPRRAERRDLTSRQRLLSEDFRYDALQPRKVFPA